MSEYRLAETESKFADLIWENEPLTSGELVQLAAEALNWKKSTTYTVLRRMCARGLFRNENGVVTSVVSRDEYDSITTERFVQDAFDGSLPRFLAAFAGRRKLRADEAAALRRMIDEYEEG